MLSRTSYVHLFPLQLNMEFELITSTTVNDDAKSTWLLLIEKIFVQAKNEEVNRSQLQQILDAQSQELKTYIGSEG